MFSTDFFRNFQYSFLQNNLIPCDRDDPLQAPFAPLCADFIIPSESTAMCYTPDDDEVIQLTEFCSCELMQYMYMSHVCVYRYIFVFDIIYKSLYAVTCMLEILYNVHVVIITHHHMKDVV